MLLLIFTTAQELRNTAGARWHPADGSPVLIRDGQRTAYASEIPSGARVIRERRQATGPLPRS